MNIKPFVLTASILALAACGDSAPDAAALRGANFISDQPGATITLSFAPDEMKVNGRVVNLYNGEYSVDGDKISFGPMATTMMMGPMDAMQTEQQYFQFLDAVETYDLAEGRLVLRDASGKELVFTQVAELPSDE
ncbi:MAG: META domain-containing protein [Alphaproteobacteria bacterium]|nr:META domain-containing protein [Alphaproteobacteria bacterium]